MLNPNATNVMSRRIGFSDSVEDEFFVLMTLGDERNIAATYVAGEKVSI